MLKNLVKIKSSSKTQKENEINTANLFEASNHHLFQQISAYFQRLSVVFPQYIYKNIKNTKKDTQQHIFCHFFILKNVIF